MKRFNSFHKIQRRRCLKFQTAYSQKIIYRDVDIPLLTLDESHMLPYSGDMQDFRNYYFPLLGFLCINVLPQGCVGKRAFLPRPGSGVTLIVQTVLTRDELMNALNVDQIMRCNQLFQPAKTYYHDPCFLPDHATLAVPYESNDVLDIVTFPSIWSP